MYGFLNLTVLLIIIGLGASIGALRFFVYKPKKQSNTALIANNLIKEETKAPADGYLCKCGQSFHTAKDLRLHVFKESIKEKGKHGKTEFKTLENAPEPEYIIDKTQPYRVMVWHYPKNGEVVVEFSRVNKPLGNLFWADPSLPESGQTYCIKETKDGKYQSYDPRHSAIISKETPQQAYYATHWDRAEGVWIFESSLWQQISKALVWLVVAGCFFTIIISLGSK